MFDEEHLDEHGKCAAFIDQQKSEIARLRSALESAVGHLLNAKIDLETGAPKRTAIMTIEGGLKTAREALAKVAP